MPYTAVILKPPNPRYTQVQRDVVSVPGGGNLLRLVVFVVVIVQYNLFIVQYKSVDFSAAAVKVPADIFC